MTEAPTLRAYAALLRQANQHVNLVSRASIADLEMRHLADCLSILPTVDRHAPASLLDIGSGAGLPALVVAIERPAIQIVALESVGKKARFLRDAITQLGVANAAVLEARAEHAAASPALRGGFDMVTARAVASLSQLCVLAAPFLAIGGVALFMKGGAIDDEVAAAGREADASGLALLLVEALDVPGLPPRSLVSYRKLRASPSLGRTAPITRRRKQKAPPAP